jgi:hypothetical protein
MFALRNPSIVFFALVSLASQSPAVAQTGTVRGYPPGTALQQTPYYSAYYPVQYGYAYPPAASDAAAYQAAYPTIRLSPQTAYYAPAQPAATYAVARPTANYTLAPAGGVSAGSEAYAYYGQPAPLNYVPPTYYGYQTRVVQVPVTYYRPYTAYQPGVAAPVTCQRATCGTVGQPATRRWFSCLDWLFHKRPCGAPAAAVPVAAVPAAVPRAVCYGNSCAPAPCGTPYYNTVPPATTVPVIPGTTVVPSTVAPPSGIRGILTPQPTVPPPGTRTIVPPAGTAIPGGTAPDGSTIRPSITPGTSVPAPGLFPGTSGSGFGPSGANYPPPVERGSAPVSSDDSGRAFVRQEAPSTQAQGSSASRGGPSSADGPALNRPTISEPTLGPRRSVQPVPDPASSERLERESPANRAPQLIDPSDRTAAARSARPGQASWGVVPATWPEKTAPPAAARRGGNQPVRQYVPAPTADNWDDTLWKSAAQ